MKQNYSLNPINVVDAIMVDSNKKILLQLRDSNKAIAGPNKWGLIGGRINSNETPEQALHREIQEETGKSVSQSKLLDEKEDSFGSTQYHHYVFFVPFVGKIVRLYEGVGFRFCTVKDLEYLELTPWFVRIYTKSINLLKTQSIL
jgi:mutator protein MutT